MQNMRPFLGENQPLLIAKTVQKANVDFPERRTRAFAVGKSLGREADDLVRLPITCTILGTQHRLGAENEISARKNQREVGFATTSGIQFLEKSFGLNFMGKISAR